MPSNKRSDEQWQSLFSEFDRSGLSAATFCRERGLPAPYFRTKYRRRSSQTSKAAFTKVQVTTPPAVVSIMVGDVQIRCEASVPNEWLAGLIHHVRA